MTDQLRNLHALWCKLTGQSPDELRYVACERILFDYVNNGFTEDNLLHVLTFLIYQNHKATEPKFRVHLRFHRIMELETFASYLGEAGPWYRNRKQKPTEKALTLASFRSTHPEPEPGGPVRSWGEVLQAIKQPKL